MYAALQPESTLSSLASGTCSKDASNLCFGIGVITRDQGPRCIIDDSCNLDGNSPLLQSSLEHWHNIVSFNPTDVESLGPSLQDAMIDGVLFAGVRKRETQMILLRMREILIVLQELCKAFCNVVK